MPSFLNIGVIGAGRIGKIHAENIAYSIPQARLRAVADINLTPEIEAWAKGLRVKTVTKSPKALLADKSLHAVIICSSTDTHADLVIAAAKAGTRIDRAQSLDDKVRSVEAKLR